MRPGKNQGMQPRQPPTCQGCMWSPLASGEWRMSPLLCRFPNLLLLCATPSLCREQLYRQMEQLVGDGLDPPFATFIFSRCAVQGGQVQAVWFVRWLSTGRCLQQHGSRRSVAVRGGGCLRRQLAGRCTPASAWRNRHPACCAGCWGRGAAPSCWTCPPRCAPWLGLPPSLPGP